MYQTPADILAKFVVDKLKKIRWGRTTEVLFWEPREDDKGLLFQSEKFWDRPEITAKVELSYTYPLSERAEDVFQIKAKFDLPTSWGEDWEELEEFLRTEFPTSVAEKYLRLIENWVNRIWKKVEKIVQDVVKNHKAWHYNDCKYLVDSKGIFHVTEIVSYVLVRYKKEAETTLASTTNPSPPPEARNATSVFVCPHCKHTSHPAEVGVTYVAPDYMISSEPDAFYADIIPEGTYDEIKKYYDKVHFVCPECYQEVSKDDIFLIEEGKPVSLSGKSAEDRPEVLAALV